MELIQDKDCKDFYRKFKDIYPREEGEVIEIYVQANKTVKDCYVKSSGKYGWCPGVGSSEVQISFSFKRVSKHPRARNGAGVKRVANMKKEHQNTPKIFWHPVFRFELIGLTFLLLY